MIGDTHRTRVYQSKVGRCTRYFERTALHTIESRYGQRDREDGTEHYDESFARGTLIIWKSVITGTDYMFERGSAVWAVRSLYLVITRHNSNIYVFAHYLLRLFITCGVSWCCR